MSPPPYHLRPNKAVDRLTLIDAIGRVVKLFELSAYTYYGLGGPYLEDFRLLYEFYPKIRMVSIEEDEEIYKRQRFHLPCRGVHLRLRNTQMRSFLTQYEANDEKSIFWLDYTGLEFACFEDVMVLLTKVAAGSLIKVTLRAEPRDFTDVPEKFREKFEAVMPNPSANPPSVSADFAYLVQQMVQIASQKALPGAVPLMFQPLSSFYYSDGTGIFTLTGAVCLRTEAAKIRAAFKGWEFRNLNWKKPTLIDVPILSTKERLHLQGRLPCRANAGRFLRKALGYLIEENVHRTEVKLCQYANFHRYSPYFMKATP